MAVRRLVPGPVEANASRVVGELLEAPPLTAFAPEVKSFCAALSKALFEPRFRSQPNLQALAFRLRPAEVQRLEDSFWASLPAPPTLVRPRGLVFHIAPANVETMFVYSWVFSALAGNRNLIRISSSAPEAVLLICRVFGDVLASAAENVQRSVAIVQYEHEQELTRVFSQACNVRVIWGGDETVRAVRAVPLAPRATELVFPDRYSFAILHVASYNALDAAGQAVLADKFFNDTFWFDQMACSSPRLVIWQGAPEDTAAAAHNFYAELERVIDRRGYSSDVGTALTRFAFGCRAILDGPVTAFERHQGRFETLTLTELTPFCRQHCGGGLLYQFHTATLDPVVEFVGPHDQTVTYFGFAGGDLERLTALVSRRGVDRIVPVGRALEFDRYWDGYDLFLEFSRHVDVR